MTPASRRATRGLTLAELLVAMLIAAVLVTIAVPTLTDFVRLQRLKSLSSTVVTDMQFARAEAAARGEWVRVNFRRVSGQYTCYTIYTIPPSTSTRCDCRSGAGSACTGGMTEIKTVIARDADYVSIRPQTGIGQDSTFAFDPVTGRLMSAPSDSEPAELASYSIHTAYPSGTPALRLLLNAAGRPSVCVAAGTISGETAC